MIAVGAKLANGRGAVYLYKFGDSEWELRQKIEPGNDVTGNSFGNFGWSVALDDSNTLIVGAPFQLNGASLESGAVFIYKEVNPNDWQIFGSASFPPDGRDEREFGFSVAIDDSVALVGARNPLAGGAAYIYNIPAGIGGSATLRQRLAENTSVGAEFGYSVALKDGSMVVGERNPDGIGSVYLYYELPEGTWALSDERISPDIDEIRYGASVAVSEDFLLVGAPQNDEGGTNTGSIFSYHVIGQCT